MEVEPSPDGFDTVVIVDVGVHRDCVGCVDDGVVRDWREIVEISKELPAVLEITGAELDNLLQMIVDPFAEWLVDGADATDDRAGLPWGFVDLWENVKVGHVNVFRALYDAVVITVAAQFTFKELLAVVVKSEVVDRHTKDASVVAFVVFESFVRRDFCILCFVQQVIVE